jgi:hypothetical protein
LHPVVEFAIIQLKFVQLHRVVAQVDEFRFKQLSRELRKATQARR